MYSTIAHSKLFYELNGFKYIDSPWIVDEEISNITKPVDKQNIYLGNKVLVASGEQSFLQLVEGGMLKSNDLWFTVTPCFRDEKQVTNTTRQYFMKTELFYWEPLSKVNEDVQL